MSITAQRINCVCHPEFPNDAADFCKITLSLEGVEEYSHAGLPAFRVGGRKFASLASQAEGHGNLMLTLEQQAAFVEEEPEIFCPFLAVGEGWGTRIFDLLRQIRTYSPAHSKRHGNYESTKTQRRAGKSQMRQNAAE